MEHIPQRLGRHHYKSPLLTNYALNSSFCESWLDSQKNNISIKKREEKRRKKGAFFKAINVLL